jgi:pyridoxine 5-phosphate synthase
MAATDDMIAIAIRTRPHAACLVPERRAERTTEGGLDVAGQRTLIAAAAKRLGGAGIRVSLFIAADPAQIEAAKDVGAPVIEIHTGAWCEALMDDRKNEGAHEFERIRKAASFATSLGLEVHAGHGLDYASAEIIAGLPEIVELNIGHFLIGEAVFVGLDNAIRTMRGAMDRGRRKGAAA